MIFAGPVDLGPVVIILFLVIAMIVAIPILAIGLFARNIAKSNKNYSPKQESTSKKLFIATLTSSIGFLVIYFADIQKGGTLSILYLVTINLFVYKMNRKWAIRTAILVTITMGIFVLNHYPQYSGRNCANYSNLTECRTPRFSL